MTDMKRITVSLPDDLAEAIERLKSLDDFKGKPVSEILRTLIKRGLELEGRV